MRILCASPLMRSEIKAIVRFVRLVTAVSWAAAHRYRSEIWFIVSRVTRKGAEDGM